MRPYNVNAQSAAASPAAAGVPLALARPTNLLKAAALVGVLCVASPALAATSGGTPMPWEGPMEQLLAFFTGPFVRIAAVISIVLLGIGMAFSENGTGMRKLTTAFFGLSLAFGAVTWGLSFFGFSGGASITPPAAEVVEAPSPTAAPASESPTL